MKHHFKPHIQGLNRYQTSSGRDLDGGIPLDRNEMINCFSTQVVSDIFSQIKPYALSTSPESTGLYGKISKTIGVEVEKIYITNGITEGVKILLEFLTRPGEGVMILEPTYPMYGVYAEMYQTDHRKIFYKRDLRPDMDRFYRELGNNTTLVMIPNPNLPIESVFSVDEIRRIAEACAMHRAILAVDEAYHYFGAPTVIDLIDEFDNLVVMRSFSKAYGLAGLRLGFMLSSAENIGYLAKTRSLVESNTLSMNIAEYMLDHHDLRDQHVQDVKAGSRYLQEELSSLGLRWFGGNVTNGMLIFLNGHSEVKRLIAYMKERKIYIRGSFDPPIENCIRVSIGPPSVMEIFVNHLKHWLGSRT